MEKMPSQAYFNEVSGDWDQMGQSYFANAPKEAIMGKTAFSEGDVVADIGCGTGYLTEGLDLNLVRAIAVDQSREMLDQMKRKFVNRPGVDYRVGGSEDLPVDSDSVDWVIANMYLHHVEHPEKAIAEMVRILRPGGQLIFTDMDTHDFEFLKIEQHDRWMGFERTDIITWMEKAGLKDVEIDCVGSRCCAESCCSGEKAEIDVFIASGKK